MNMIILSFNYAIIWLIEITSEPLDRSVNLLMLIDYPL